MSSVSTGIWGAYEMWNAKKIKLVASFKTMEEANKKAKEVFEDLPELLADPAEMDCEEITDEPGFFFHFHF